MTDHLKNAMTFFMTVVLALILVACSAEKPAEKIQKDDPAYVADVDAWHAKRIESLTSPTSWLSLAGLFWLEEGENSFGADESNAIIFPKDRAPSFFGSFALDKGEVKVRIKPDVKVLAGDTTISEMILQTDENGKPTVLKHGSLSWYAIKRGNRFGIRLKDSENTRIKEFKGIERFPVSTQWRIEAKYLPYDPPKKISIVNVLGSVSEEPSPGALKFRIDGKTYRLDALGEPDDEELFIVFADTTNGFETYGGGRFLDVKKPDGKGMTYIDFNRAYNPPCTFTEFATCPLPPAQNKLPVKITAGEKNYGDALH